MADNGNMTTGEKMRASLSYLAFDEITASNQFIVKQLYDAIQDIYDGNTPIGLQKIRSFWTQHIKNAELENEDVLAFWKKDREKCAASFFNVGVQGMLHTKNKQDMKYALNILGCLLGTEHLQLEHIQNMKLKVYYDEELSRYLWRAEQLLGMTDAEFMQLDYDQFMSFD